MKKYFFILSLFLTSVAFSQIEKPIAKGNMMIGGAMELSSLDIHFNSFEFNASPQFGYFVANHLAIGLQLPFHLFKAAQIHNLRFGYSPFVRYYFSNGLFASFQFEHLFYVHQNLNSIQTSKSWLMFSPGIGYSYFLNKNIALEGGLFYEHSFETETGSTSNTDLYLRFGFQLFLIQSKD